MGGHERELCCRLPAGSELLRNWEVTCTFVEEDFDRGELEEVLEKLLTKLRHRRATEPDFS